MNRYQVILANHDMLHLNADAVNTTTGRLVFLEHAGEANEAGEIPAHTVAEFQAWAGWNCLGKYMPAEVPDKAEVLKADAPPSAQDIAASLQAAIDAAARGQQ